jgi:hypothetical protein
MDGAELWARIKTEAAESGEPCWYARCDDFVLFSEQSIFALLETLGDERYERAD